MYPYIFAEKFNSKSPDFWSNSCSFLKDISLRVANIEIVLFNNCAKSFFSQKLEN